MKKIPTLSFLYLIQGSKENIQKFHHQNPKLDILSLTFDEPLEGSIYFPKSTWTDGRNVLFREARKIV